MHACPSRAPPTRSDLDLDAQLLPEAEVALRDAVDDELLDLVARSEVGRGLGRDLLGHAHSGVHVVAQKQTGTKRGDFSRLHPTLDVGLAACIDELANDLLEHVEVRLIQVLGQLLGGRLHAGVASPHADHPHRG